LATNQQLRDAVFRIGEIQRQSREVQAELQQALAQQEKIQEQLAEAQTQLASRTERLLQINRSLKTAIARQRRSEQQLKQLQSQFQRIKSNLQRSTAQAQTLRAEIKRLATEERQLQAERQQLLIQRDQAQDRLKQGQARLTLVQSQLTQAKAQKQVSEAAAAQAQDQLQKVETQKQRLVTEVMLAREQVEEANAEQVALLVQQTRLQQEITALEANRERLTRNLENLQKNVEVLLLGLRRGNITIRTGQILAAATVQGLTEQTEALRAVDALLLQARKTALALIQPTTETTTDQVIQISQQEVERLVQQMSDSQSYVIRILAAANYLQGEQSVLVVAQLAPNQLVFEQGDAVSAIAINPSGMSDEQLLTALNQLFQQSNRQALEAGILANPLTGTVGEFEQIELFRFILALQDRKIEGTVEIFAITADPISVAGPLKLKLIAVQDQRVILRSN
jgi:uncharacterized protein (DUF3084 family)